MIYAACYQDDSEPWGWAADSLWSTPEAAQARVDVMAEHDIKQRSRWWPEADDEDRARIIGLYKVKEYELDVPGKHWSDDA